MGETARREAPLSADSTKSFLVQRGDLVDEHALRCRVTPIRREHRRLGDVVDYALAPHEKVDRDGGLARKSAQLFVVFPARKLVGVT